MNTIADRLKIVMGVLTGRQFAVRLGKSPTTVNEYLKGRMPPADFIELVCDHFNVDPGWLLTGVVSGSVPEKEKSYLRLDNQTNASVVNEDSQYSGDLPMLNKNIINMINVLDISDEDFCRRLEIDGGELRRIKSGAPVSGIMLRAICYEFDVRMRWLRNNEGPVRAEIGSPAVKDLWAKFSNAYRDEIDKD